MFYLERHLKKKKIKSEFHVFVWFPGLQNLDAFEKISYVGSFEIISSRNDFLQSSVFGFSNSLLCGLEESTECRALLS